MQSRLTIRILYTINSSPQYILARSLHKLPTTPVLFQRAPRSHYPTPVNDPYDVNHAHDGNTGKYATCSLKACLDAICRSSPELVQDSTRDFSVYVLDPLESFSSSAPDASTASSSQSTQQHQQHPRGVAVGLGLMSWALLADEETSEAAQVTGTLMTAGNGEEALEVIFALKETFHMQKASLSPTLKSWGLPPAPPTSAPKRSKVLSNHPQGASSSSKRVGPSTASSSKTKENESGKARASNSGAANISSAGAAAGGEAVSGDRRFEALVRTLQNATAVSTPSAAQPTQPTQPAEQTRYARSSDFPLSNAVIWRGPEPRKKVGRPPKNGKAKEKEKTREVPGPERRGKELFTREPLGPRGSASPSEAQGAQMDAQTQMALLSLISSALSQPGGTGDQAAVGTNGAALSALGAIDSSTAAGAGGEGGVEPSPALVNALKELLAAACAPHGPASVPPLCGATTTVTNHTNTTTNTNINNNNMIDNTNTNIGNDADTYSRSESHGKGEGEDEIVVLDKENVNPGAFRRKGGKGNDGGGNSNAKASGGTRERVGLGETTTNLNVDEGNKRKRTLSDFMEEKEAERERERGRVRDTGTGKKRAGTGAGADGIIHRPQHTQSDTDYPFTTSTSTSRSTTTTSVTARVFSNAVLTANLAFRPHTSPPRPTFGSRPFQRAVSFNSTASTSAAASPADDPLPSYVPASAEAVTTTAPLPKKYVVPAWARTNTTTQPRLSEEVLAQRAAAAAAAEAEAERERKERKRRGRKRKEVVGTNENESALAGTEKECLQGSASSRGGLSSSSLYSLPVCASSDLTVVSPSSPLPVSSPPFASDASTTPFSSQDPEVPKTPPPRHRRRHALTPSSKCIMEGSGGDGSSALFTPTPQKLSGLFDSPLFSPSVSALSRKGKTKISPIRAVTSGKGWDEEEDDDQDERLRRELDDALEELEVPSSSLPIASSDFDTDPPATSSSSGGHRSASDEPGEDETMRYWSTGLPPSSPPPPTSPVLHSQTDDEDMEDIANAMSDSDGLTFEHDPLDQQHQQFLIGDASSSAADFMNSDIPFSDDLAMCFDDFSQLFSDPMIGTMTNNKIDDASLLPLPSSDPVVQNGLADFDFTQFWESVKPLVDNQSSTMSLPSDSLAGSAAEIDHVKLAEEVHALFSGCLM